MEEKYRNITMIIVWTREGEVSRILRNETLIAGSDRGVIPALSQDYTHWISSQQRSPELDTFFTGISRSFTWTYNPLFNASKLPVILPLSATHLRLFWPLSIQMLCITLSQAQAACETMLMLVSGIPCPCPLVLIDP